MSELIRIRNLVIQRNGRDVLRIPSLEIKRGETLAVVGPNGAGKSTLLLALAGLLKPVRGEILFEGNPLTARDDLVYRRRIAFVFQSPLLMDMSVEQNVALGLKFRGVAKEQAAQRAHIWIERLGIQSLSKRRAGELSGGEAQRVSLARALVLDPELLLFDEPFVALDPPTRAALIADLAQLLQGKTVVFVTHNLKEAAKLGGRIAVVLDGMLRQVGTAKQIKTMPADKAVKTFLKELPR